VKGGSVHGAEPGGRSSQPSPAERPQLIPMNPVTFQNARVARPSAAIREDLHITAGRIAAGPGPSASELDLRDHVVFPGLVNAHDHLHLNNVPRLRSDRFFPNSYRWAERFATHFAAPDVAAAMAVPAAARYRHGGLKNLLGGATTVAHHDPWHPALNEEDFPVNLLRRFGWCHSLGLAPRVGVPARVRERLAGLAGRPRRGPFGPPIAESFADTPRGAPWIIHLAEGIDAVAGAELRQLDRLGYLTAQTVLVHGVGLGGDDVGRVIARGAAVVWCPSSNIAIFGATLDPRRLFQAHRLALGTDSRLSGARDLLDELRVAAANCDLTPVDIVRLATIEASRILAIPEVGGLDVGQRADLVIVRDDGADPYRALITRRRAELRAVVHGGLPAIADPDFAPWFAAAGVDTVDALLDDRPKLLARSLARPQTVACEPGLRINV
jgi:cytosine/adenosine deaminase-related metal-dependent hydrolase